MAKTKYINPSIEILTIENSVILAGSDTLDASGDNTSARMYETPYEGGFSTKPTSVWDDNE